MPACRMASPPVRPPKNGLRCPSLGRGPAHTSSAAPCAFTVVAAGARVRDASTGPLQWAVRSAQTASVGPRSCPLPRWWRAAPRPGTGLPFQEASDVLPGLGGADHRGSSRPLEMSATPTAVEGAAGRPSSQRDKRIHAIPESWPALALLICGEYLWTSCRRTGGSEPECRSPGSGGCGSPSTTPPPPRWEVAIRHAVQTGRRTPPDTEGAVPRRRFT